MKNFKSFLLAASLVLFTGNGLFSAPPPPPSGGPGCWPPPCIPVDNGLVFLMIAGAALVAKKLYDLRKKNSVIS